MTLPRLYTSSDCRSLYLVSLNDTHARVSRLSHFLVALASVRDTRFLYLLEVSKSTVPTPERSTRLRTNILLIYNRCSITVSNSCTPLEGVQCTLASIHIVCLCVSFHVHTFYAASLISCVLARRCVGVHMVAILVTI